MSSAGPMGEKSILPSISGAGDAKSINVPIPGLSSPLEFSLPKELRVDKSGKRDDRALGGRTRA